MFMLERYLKYFIIILYPRYWFGDKDYPYSKNFDEWILTKLAEGEVPKFKKYSSNVLNFAGKQLWFSRVYSAADFTLFGEGVQVSPSRLTKIKLWKMIHQAQKNRNFFTS